MQSPRDFKVCTSCKLIWRTRSEFLGDPDVVLLGYQANFDSPSDGVVLFAHRHPDCGTTLAIEVFRFGDLYAGDRFQERKAETEDCPGFCLDWYNRKLCLAKCDCAFVREVLQLLSLSPEKRAGLSPGKNPDREVRVE